MFGDMKKMFKDDEAMAIMSILGACIGSICGGVGCCLDAVACGTLWLPAWFFNVICLPTGGGLCANLLGCLGVTGGAIAGCIGGACAWMLGLPAVLCGGLSCIPAGANILPGCVGMLGQLVEVPTAAVTAAGINTVYALCIGVLRGIAASICPILCSLPGNICSIICTGIGGCPAGVVAGIGSCLGC